jgi:hypothetical protein
VSLRARAIDGDKGTEEGPAAVDALEVITEVDLLATNTDDATCALNDSI